MGVYIKLAFWKSSILPIKIIGSSPQFIHCEVEDRIHGNGLLTVIYSSLNVAARNSLWDAVRDFGHNLHTPWLVICDFIVVLYSYERSPGCLGMGNKDKVFGDLVNDVGLIDLGFSGPKLFGVGVLAATFLRGLGSTEPFAIWNGAWLFRM